MASGNRSKIRATFSAAWSTLTFPNTVVIARTSTIRKDAQISYLFLIAKINNQKIYLRVRSVKDEDYEIARIWWTRHRLHQRRYQWSAVLSPFLPCPSFYQVSQLLFEESLGKKLFKAVQDGVERGATAQRAISVWYMPKRCTWYAGYWSWWYTFRRTTARAAYGNHLATPANVNLIPHFLLFSLTCNIHQGW